MRRVLLGVPSHRNVRACKNSWFAQKAPDTWVDVYIERYNPFPTHLIIENLEVKNEIMRDMCLAGKYDYLFMVEDDIILPPDALEKLLAVDHPIVSGLYRLRPEHSGTDAFMARIVDVAGPQDSDTQFLKLSDIKEFGEIIECTLVGAGCLLIRCDLLEQLGGVMKQDGLICERLRPLHIQPLCHTGVLCGHVEVTGEIIGVKTHGNTPNYRLFDCSPCSALSR